MEVTTNIYRSEAVGSGDQPLAVATNLYRSEAAGSGAAPGDLVWNTQIGDMMVHLNHLQKISDTFGNRDSAQPGFNASVEYVLSQLTGTGFTIRREFFQMEGWIVGQTQLTTTDADGFITTYTSGQDFNPVTNSGRVGNNVENGTAVHVENSGCTVADWDAAVARFGSLVGRVAVMSRSGDMMNCPVGRQSQFANNYKAGGLIVFNTNDAPPTVLPLDIVTRFTPIPVFIVTRAIGLSLVSAIHSGDMTFIDMSLYLHSDNTVMASNIIADTPSGDWKNTIVVGSHIDGVRAGPGINDNGSGSSANLAMALRIAEWIKQGVWKLPNRIRFVWFGAEEHGLFGSRFHVFQAQHNPNPRDSTDSYVVMLNYDMLASPNFINGVYNATVAPAGTPTKALAGSLTVTNIYYDFFTQNNLPYSGVPFDGRSDYGQFVASGIVAGGLFSGAEVLKSQATKDRYALLIGANAAGMAGVAYDPCYHQACDSIQNIHQGGYLNLTRAAAHTLQVLAMQQDLRGFLNYLAYAPSEQ